MSTFDRSSWDEETVHPEILGGKQGGVRGTEKDYLTDERVINHIVLSTHFDFVPQVIIPDGKMNAQQTLLEFGHVAFPIEKINGVNALEYIATHGKNESFSVVLQQVRQFSQLLRTGVFIFDRDSFRNSIVDRHGKLWQIDMEGVYDIVGKGKLGRPENITLTLNEKRTQNLSESQLNSLENKKKYYVKCMQILIQKFLRAHKSEMSHEEISSWNSSLREGIQLGDLLVAIENLSNFYTSENRLLSGEKRKSRT